MADVWIVVPAYQEATAIEKTLRGLFAYLPNVVVVDDGSTDGTAAAARRAGADVVRHAINLGQGAALATGIAYALRSGATHVCTFDADGQHDPRTIDAMFSRLVEGDVDVVLGSRFLGATVGISRVRRAFLRLAVLGTRLHTGLPVSDTHNGLRMFTRDAIERVVLRQPRMAHGSEILSEIARIGLRFAEIPTTISYTPYSIQKGQSLFNSVKIAFDLMYSALSRSH